ncbi:hypothetical protein [Staphylospora marina]|uniref:hypothetical protein n=1 Tax=Staphylospora marina TaxID=2490858 RepID=UPI000F5BE184|nr:hypothetical protein [Staphylospora marina]
MGKSVRYVFWTLVTMGVEAGITWFLASTFAMPFEELVFFVSIVGATVVWFFTSQGSFSSMVADTGVQATTGHRMEQEKSKVFRNPVLFGALLFVLVSGILTLTAYRNYIF